MRRGTQKLALCAVLGLASAVFAKDPKPFQTGKLLQMDSVRCGAGEKDAKSLAQELPCHEYLLQAERVIYRIRPRDAKHAALLPVGDQAQFRLEKDKMLLRVDDLDNPYRDSPERSGPDRTNKEREYIVVSMTPRSDSTAADATPTRLNHLQ
jgi:hypothetical protein